MTLGDSTGLTDTGRRRRRNEDAFVCRPPLFAVADGMGGAQAGEVASRLAAAVLKESPETGTGEQRVAELIKEANRRVFQRSNEDATASGMGTTMTVALVDPTSDTIAIGHVGDSRAYRVRDGELEQLTEDHSLVAELLRSGKLDPDEARTHPQRSVITRALGTESEVDVDTFTVEARPGDVYLICSDGLSSMVNDADILAVVEESRDDLRTTARQLVAAANRGGGDDNITVIVFEIAAGPSGDTATLQPVGERGHVYEDEDTLSGLEPVPVVELTTAAEAEPVLYLEEEDTAESAATLTPADAPRRRRRRWPWLLLLVLFVGIVVALVVWGLAR